MTQQIIDELAQDGLRLANDNEAGWYVITSGGKVWATEMPTVPKAVSRYSRNVIGVEPNEEWLAMANKRTENHG